MPNNIEDLKQENIEEVKVETQSNKKRKYNMLKIFIGFIIVFGATFGFYEVATNTKDNKYISPREHAVEITELSNLKNIKEVDLVKDLGAIPNDNQDDSPAFQKALDMSRKEPIRLIIPEGEYLSTGTRVLEATEIKGLHIKGDNAIIKPKNPLINANEYYFMKLFLAENNQGVEIEGITVDGSLNPQDLYFTLEKPEDVYKLPLQRGFYIQGANDIFVHDMTFQHMYGGYTITAFDYQNVDIARVKIDDVGGDDITDSFGMAFYFDGHIGDAQINIDEVHAQGKVSERDPSYTAWIGVVLQNTSIQNRNKDVWLEDVNTVVNITNSSFLDYETTFHVESMAGNVYWNSDNIKTRAKDYFIAAGINGEIKERTNNLYMEMTPYGRNGIVHGLYYTENEKEKNISGTHEFTMYNSVINYLKVDGYKSPSVGASYGDSVIGTYSHVTFNNLPKYLVINGSANVIDSQINLAKDNPLSAEKLTQGQFSESHQYVKFIGTTKVNPYGSHITASPGTSPDWFTISGKIPEPLKDPLAPAELKE